MTGKNSDKQRCNVFLVLLVLVLSLSLHAKSCLAGDFFNTDSIKNTLGGYFRLNGSVSFPEDQSVYNAMGHDRLHDGDVELRIRDEIDYKDRVSAQVHYEMIGTGGETLKIQKKILAFDPALSDFLGTQTAVNDDRRLMDLTHVLSNRDDYYIYHRIDRLMVTVKPDWGTVSIGRQAVTWGNGFLFNPMDLFNPFAPTDVIRDYKIGDDMILTQVYAGSGDVQVLYVPRRNPNNHNIEWGQSSLAGKYHFTAGTTEIDIMAGHHYADQVVGIGLTGYLMEAAWRISSTYTNLDDDTRRSGFAEVSANMDYSWVWWSKNMYGWIEFYYSGLGNSDVEKALLDPDIIERIERGERFTTGRAYMDAQMQIELHPLVNFFTGLISNLNDSSGIIQPRIVWDAKQNLQVIFGGNIYYGKSNTEFGGLDIPATDLKFAEPDAVYAWITWYF